MKYCRFTYSLLLLLFVLLLPGFLKSQEVFQLEKSKFKRVEFNPSLKYIVLDKSWKYKEGDSNNWASPEYNDNNWASINPTLDIHKLPQLRPGKIGWLRLVLQSVTGLDSNLSLNISQSGAAEYYLDGKLIYKFGVVSTDPNKIVARDPLAQPVPFHLADTAHHVLAIRYALQPGLHYTTMFQSTNTALGINLLTAQDALEVHEYYSHLKFGLILFISGVCVLLFILHFAFYLFYPAKKANLMLAIYAIGFYAFNVLQYYFFLRGNEVAYRFFVGNIAMDLRMLCNFFLLTAIYKLFGFKRDAAYLILVILLIAGFFLNVWPYDIGWRFGGAATESIVGLGVIRIAFIATRRKIRGAWIILAGAIGYFISFTIFLFWVMSSSLTLGPSTLYVLSFLCIPVATSILLGLDFAFTNKTLEQKLREVEQLSQKNIEQQREKQEMLLKQNEMLETQVRERTQALSRSLEKVKATQAQLIQSEKMASLGELTAGIAHEIQNPLNFVNNFSDVNKELIAEMQDEIQKGNIAGAKQIAKDIISNEEKINEHGKRADAIVKSMLQHSRISTGQKELTDINSLCDEYLRLSYHGMRAKDKSFNVLFKTEYDSSAGQINIVPQDIGRVFLNLFNNSFYSVTERKKNAIDFEPAIEISTRRKGEIVEISIKDNGIGISENNREKIFQPFFTAKPAGKGTGLGLSLSYDIVVKGHGGQIILNDAKQGCTEFIVMLNSN